ncbi:MAG TPA: hypothetical protein VG842_00650 [Sediminibacterium sp.]|nr:hypothetical protein [Sediminibacterium sp.]
MYVAWVFTPKRKLVVAIIDKTVQTSAGQEHISLDWVLTQEKFTKNNNQLYRSDKDYFGFFPGQQKKYQLRGLEALDEDQINQLSEESDLVYMTDSYGIFRSEWMAEGNAQERSGIIYGGMSDQDLALFSAMKARHKLIVSEFNSMGSPTTPDNRARFENAFGVKWTGWIGRYFDSFDTTVNKELPKWLIHNYRRQHGGAWPFRKSGIAFIHTGDQIVIVEKEKELLDDIPRIEVSREGQNHYQLPQTIRYPFWFDIVAADTGYNHYLATFQLDVNEKGRALLQQNGIPSQFPAITVHINRDYRFFYFSGDFCDNPIVLSGAYLKWVHYLDWFFYNRHDPQERRSFFWLFYRPLVTTILNDYYHTLHHP